MRVSLHGCPSGGVLVDVVEIIGREFDGGTAASAPESDLTSRSKVPVGQVRSLPDRQEWLAIVAYLIAGAESWFDGWHRTHQ